MLIDTITHIYPKTASVFSPSLAFAAVIMLLLPNLSDLLASNNLDNTSQKKFEFREIINLTNNEKDSVYGQVSASNDNVYVVWQESDNSYKLGTKYTNNLFAGDINNGNLYFFKVNDDRTGLNFEDVPGIVNDLIADNQEEVDEVILGTGFGGITDIETGPDGNLYILSYQDGLIYRLTNLNK